MMHNCKIRMQRVIGPFRATMIIGGGGRGNVSDILPHPVEVGGSCVLYLFVGLYEVDGVRGGAF